MKLWVPAAELPWIRGTTAETKSDNRRLVWITIGMMILGLLGVAFIQGKSGEKLRHDAAIHVVAPPK